MKRAIAKPVVRVITRHRQDCSRRNRGQRVHSCSCLKSLAWTLDGKTFVDEYRAQRKVTRSKAYKQAAALATIPVFVNFT